MNHRHKRYSYQKSSVSILFRPSITFLVVLLLVLLAILPVTQPWAEAEAAQTLHQPWTDLLRQHVSDGRVDYQGFKEDEAALDRYLETLAETDPEQLGEDDRLALYINAYNAYTVKLILENFKNGQPPESIRRIGGLFASPWQISFAVIGGETFSLDNIEHDIIRVEFDEPRIHFAVNCASLSCPPLISEAYRGETLDLQLEQSSRNFLEDTRHNYYRDGSLYVSSIFKWYSEDFNDDPVAFFLLHSPSVLPDDSTAGDIKVKYLDYDWSLNGKQVP
ncbi:MAG: DUF547 domain-containing protein [Desulfocapsaceae bacterium]